MVEDEFFQASELGAALEEQGVTVIGPAPSSREALDLLEAAEWIDAAVVDINLHGDCSMVFADRLMADDIPFVFLSGYDRSWLAPAYSHIDLWPKPLDGGTMRSWLHRIGGR